MRKKTSPLLILGAIVGGWFVIDAIAKRTGEQAAAQLMTRLASGEITIAPGKQWRVRLRDGRQVQMNSVQLKNAIESRAVKAYSEMPTTA